MSAILTVVGPSGMGERNGLEAVLLAWRRRLPEPDGRDINWAVLTPVRQRFVIRCDSA